MERWRTQRNIAIVLALGVAVYFIPGGGRAANAVEAVLWVAFGIGIGYLLVRLYRERQLMLMALGERHRGLLYGAVALAAFCFMARSRMWESGIGELGWFLMAGLAVYALAEVYRHARSYS
jgi:hypothetical protein